MGIKIIIGAGETESEGWVSLEHDQLDMRNRADWSRQFQPDSIDAVLSEHVLEHLYPGEAEIAARNVFEFLAPGGYWRIAVPDANNPDPNYFEHCRPGGSGQRVASWWAALGVGHNTPDHKVFYSIESLTNLLRVAGFEVRPLEWFTSEGVFRQQDWSQSDGTVRRSAGHPWLFTHWLLHGTVGLSLIVDAVKR